MPSATPEQCKSPLFPCLPAQGSPLPLRLRVAPQQRGRRGHRRLEGPPGLPTSSEVPLEGLGVPLEGMRGDLSIVTHRSRGALRPGRPR